MNQTDRELLKLVTTNPIAFSIAFFGGRKGYLEEGLPDFGKQVFKLIEQRHPKTAVILPRGHLKSTLLSKIYPLYLALREPCYIRIYSATDALTQTISSIHDRELRTNQKLNYYFGNQVTKDNTWTVHRKVLANGSTIEYASIGKQTRGVTSVTGRPDVIILDDIETTEQARSQYLTDQLDEWLIKDVQPALAARGRIILLGTVISKLALAYRISSGQVEGWEKLVLAACDFEKGTTLWPQNPNFARIEQFEKMKREAASMNRVADFHSEYLNEPLDNVEQPFTVPMLKYHQQLPEYLRYFCTIDMAYSGREKKHSDKTAWVIGACDPENNRYIIEARKDRLNAQERVDLCFNLINKYKYQGLAGLHIEGHTDFLSHTLPQEMKLRNQYFAVTELKHHGVSKIDRILSLQPALKRITFDIHNCKELIDELLAWNTNSNVDDLSDALAYFDKVAEPAAHPTSRLQRIDHTIVSAGELVEIMSGGRRSSPTVSIPQHRL